MAHVRWSYRTCAEDGTMKEKTTNRREWSAQPAMPEREVADTTPKGSAVAAGTPELPEHEQEAGMGRLVPRRRLLSGRR